MQLLIVAATQLEIAPLVARLGASSASESGPKTKSWRKDGHHLDVLVTGPGMVATAFWCSHAMERKRYDAVMNLGVCGSFDSAIAPLTAVHVRTDCFAELGAEDGEQFLSAHELRLIDNNEFPFEDGRLVNKHPPSQMIAGLIAVDGITVNTVHGNEGSIAAVVQRFNPQIESMEGAAFMYASLIHELAFAQVRVVSNIVERRNRASWKMAEAVELLGETAWAILDRA